MNSKRQARRNLEIRHLDDITWQDYTPEPRTARRTVSVLARMAVVAVLLGLLAGLLVLPGLLAAGLTAREVSNYYIKLPAALAEPPLPQPSQLLDRDGNVYATVAAYERLPVPAEKMSRVLREGVVAVEDARFYTHDGFDPVGIARALYANATGTGGLQGASTITQQYVKNVLVMAADLGADDAVSTTGADVSVTRKIREVKLAMAVDRTLDKDEILTRYLNVAYLGNGSYGVEAAARRYFSVSAAELNAAQAAVLISLLKNPTGYDPFDNPDLATQRRNIVLSVMADHGVITEKKARRLTRRGLMLDPSTPARGCHASKYPFYCSHVLRLLGSDPAFGKTEQARQRLLTSGGLTVRTALDPDAMAAAETAAASTIPAEHRVATGVSVVEPGTGKVAAIATNRHYGTGVGATEVIYPVDSRMQPGSTFKLFTLAAALDQKMPLDTTVPGGSTYKSTALNNPSKGYYSNSAGSLTNPTLAQATQMSMNTAFVQLEERVGVKAVAEMANRLGVKSVAGSGPTAPGDRDGSFTLGTASVGITEMASAYATIAAHGRACDPIFIEHVTTRDGVRLPGPGGNCHEAIDPAAADSIAHILGTVVTSGTGKPAAFGRPAAGKTGTTENLGAAWFAGFTPQYATTVWVGDPRGGSSYPLYDVLGYSHVYGGTLPATVWRRTMTDLHAGLPVKPLPGPDESYLVRAEEDLITSTVGLPYGVARDRLRVAGVADIKVKRTDRGSGQASGYVVAQDLVGVRAEDAVVTLTVTR